MVSIILITLPTTVLAQGGPFDKMISGILSAMWKIFGVFAVIGLVVSGILFLTAQGDPQKIQIAKQALLYGIIGVIVGIVAYSIVNIISNVIGA